MKMEDKIIIFDKFKGEPSGELRKGETTVRNLEDKKNRPSVFIGSATESHPIAKKIQSFFDSKRYDVDTWKMNIFGQKDSDGDSLSNAEQLKNFTDIYDFAIFIFTPDDKLISQTRINREKGAMAEAYSTRHNVVFEFGLFLGRLGAERSFILYDDDVQDFVDYFFTDLKDDFSYDTGKKKKTRFKIESHSYKGRYLEYLKSGGEVPAFDEKDLQEKVIMIQNKIEETNEEISIGFLPSTSLAKGFYNNFLKRVIESVSLIHSPENSQQNIPETILKQTQEDKGIKEIVESLRKKKKIHIKIVVPDSLAMTRYDDFQDIFENPFFKKGSIPIEKGRPKTVYYQKSSISDSSKEFFIYDIPSTMNSSIEAINMTTEHKDIKELLSEKERRNFIKVMNSLFEVAKEEEATKRIMEFVSIISWDEFREETQLEI